MCIFLCIYIAVYAVYAVRVVRFIKKKEKKDPKPSKEGLWLKNGDILEFPILGNPEFHNHIVT